MYQKNYNTSIDRGGYSYTAIDKKRSYKSNPKISMIMAVILLLFGIWVIVVQFNEYREYMALAKEENSTNAIVTYVDKKTTSGNRSSTRRIARKTYYNVIAKYTVDREDYTLEFDSRTSYDVGERIKIFYDEDNPSNYVREGDSGVGTLLAGVLFTVAIGIKGGVGYKKYRKEKELRSMGVL